MYVRYSLNCGCGKFKRIGGFNHKGDVEPFQELMRLVGDHHDHTGHGMSMFVEITPDSEMNQRFKLSDHTMIEEEVRAGNGK